MDHRDEPGEPFEEPAGRNREYPLDESEGYISGERKEDPWGEPAADPRQDPWAEPVEPHREETLEPPQEVHTQGKVYVSGEESGVTSRPGQHYIGKAIVSIQEGRKIGSVADIVINGDSLQVAAVITSKGAFFNREVEAILAEEIQVWGEDVVLVEVPDVIKHESQIPERNRWLYLNDSIRGRYVVSVDGTRVGQIGDVLIDTHGTLRGYELSKVFIEGPVADSKRITADATHSLGKDVLVVNTIQALTHPDEKKGRAVDESD
jgi:uncharacterized protein YrrD